MELCRRAGTSFPKPQPVPKLPRTKIPLQAISIMTKQAAPAFPDGQNPKAFRNLAKKGKFTLSTLRTALRILPKKALSSLPLRAKNTPLIPAGKCKPAFRQSNRKTAHANYYFGTDGVMATGKQTIYNEDLDEDQVWYFQTEGSYKGQGFHGVRDNTLYEQGLRKQADSDLKLAPVSFEGKWYLVNASGSLQKATASSKSAVKPKLGAGYKDFKDANGGIWVTDVNGVLH